MNLGRLRHLIQIVSFFLSNLGANLAMKTGGVYPFLYCYGCPLASGACPIGTLQNFVTWGICPFYLLGILGVYGTIFGRAFCGWACPFGAVQDLLAGLSKKKRKLRPFTYSKFIMLALVVSLAWFTLDTVFCKFCPVGSLFAAIPAPIHEPALVEQLNPVHMPFFFVHIATLILTIFLVLLFSRFWCRYLCPLGTIGVFNRLSIMTISLDSTKCTSCLKCLDVCPMGLKKIGDIGLSSDCIVCGRCIDACPTDALKIHVRK
jgi:ferredoxin-type protein NapH